MLHRLRMARSNGWIVALPSLLIGLGVAEYFRRLEGSGPNLLCTSAITLALWAVLTMATRRIFVSTVATHWPYHVTFFPDEKVPGGGEGVDAEMNEFLRRRWLSKTDLEDMRAQLGKRFPGQRFLIVHYGDHHPVATRQLLGFAPNIESEDVDLPPDSPGFITYFAMQGVNYTLPPLPVIDPIDVAYLPALIIYAAGLPLPDSDVERLRLMKLCDSRYYDCPAREEILGFHQRLIAAEMRNPRRPFRNDRPSRHRPRFRSAPARPCAACRSWWWSRSGEPPHRASRESPRPQDWARETGGRSCH